MKQWMMTGVLSVAVIGCGSKEPTTVKRSREVMGTFAEVTGVAGNVTTASTAVEKAYAVFNRVNELMSDYREDSEIGRLNRLAGGGQLVVSPETFFCLQYAAQVSERSGGAFDVTCRPLVSLWKQAGQEKKLPTRAAIDAARRRVGWQKLRLDPNARTVTVTTKGLRVDLGGIAKGYALDLGATAMREAGAQGAMLDIGGDVLAIGRRGDGERWMVGVQHPFKSGILMKLAVEDRAVATSGNQQRFSIIEGKRYSHIIDPRTGYPAEQAPSVTVIAPTGIASDAWATVFSVLSVDDGRALVRTLKDVDVLWVWGNADNVQMAQTDGFQRYVVE